VALEYQLGNF